MTKIVLLDSHAIIHRAYHAMPDFKTRDGVPTGGLFGVCSILLAIIQEQKPDYIFACYDLPGGTFRHEAYDDYKAGRREADDALIQQIIKSKDIFEAFNIPTYEMAGFEADDLLGTLTEIFKKDPNNKIVIATGDHDTMQLVDENQVSILTPQKGTDVVLWNEARVLEKYGFASDYIPDYKGLAGDPSDNIKGIKGIGKTTATKLIQQFGTVEEIFEVTKNKPDELKKAGITARMQKLLEEGEMDALFSKELARIKCDVPIKVSLPIKTFTETLDFGKLTTLFRELEFRTMLERVKKSVGVENTADELSKKELVVDESELARYKIGVFVLNPTIADPTLDDVLRFSESGDFEEAKNVIESDIRKLNLEYVWKEIECPLIPILAEINKHGFLVDKKLLEKKSVVFNKKVDQLEKEIYELAGTEFNIKSTQQLGKILFETLALGGKGLKKTPKGALSTKESELEKLKDSHPIIEKILEYRELTKLVSTYIDNIIPIIGDDGRLHSRFIQTGAVTGRMASKDPNLQNIPTGGDYGREIREVFIASPGTKLVSFDYSQIELRTAAMLSGDKVLVETFKNGEDIHSRVSLEIFGAESPEFRRKAKVINFGILYGMGASALRKNLGEKTTTADEARQYLDLYFQKFSGLAKYLEATKEAVKESGYSETLYGRKRFFPEIHSNIPFIKASAERMAINAPIQGTATADIIKLALIDVVSYIKQEKLENEISVLAQVHDELIFEMSEKVVDVQSKKIKTIMEAVLDKHKPQNNFTPVPLLVGVHQGSSWAELK